MKATEHETIILLNDADLAEGYFQFSTTKELQFRKLCKRIGGEANLLDVKTSSANGAITGWLCKVPSIYFSKATFAIRQKSQARVGNAKFLQK